MERRTCTRINEPFPVQISGIDHWGEEFQADTVVDNLSASGLYVRLPRTVNAGAKLSMIMRISPSMDEAVSAPRIAAKGVVVRSVPMANGHFGLGVAFTQHRFI